VIESSYKLTDGKALRQQKVLATAERTLGLYEDREHREKDQARCILIFLPNAYKIAMESIILTIMT
jgi:hypothetical protein